MNYHLSFNSILSSIHAFAALHSMACGDEGRSLLAPMLCRPCSPLVENVVEGAFLEVVLGLGPVVSDMEMPPQGGEAGADRLLRVELVTPRDMAASRNTIVRRALEQCVALTALDMWCRASAAPGRKGSGTPAPELAEGFASVASEWRSTLLSALTPVTYPCLRCR